MAKSKRPKSSSDPPSEPPTEAAGWTYGSTAPRENLPDAGLNVPASAGPAVATPRVDAGARPVASDGIGARTIHIVESDRTRRSRRDDGVSGRAHTPRRSLEAGVPPAVSSGLIEAGIHLLARPLEFGLVAVLMPVAWASRFLGSARAGHPASALRQATPRK